MPTVHLVRHALAGLCGSPVETGSVARDGRSLAWVAAGDGATILLSAGAGETVLTWAPLIAGLATRGRIVA